MSVLRQKLPPKVQKTVRMNFYTTRFHRSYIKMFARKHAMSVSGLINYILYEHFFGACSKRAPIGREEYIIPVRKSSPSLKVDRTPKGNLGSIPITGTTQKLTKTLNTSPMGKVIGELRSLFVRDDDEEEFDLSKILTKVPKNWREERDKESQTTDQDT